MEDSVCPDGLPKDIPVLFGLFGDVELSITQKPEDCSRLDHTKKHQGNRLRIHIGTNLPSFLTLPDNLVQPFKVPVDNSIHFSFSLWIPAENVFRKDDARDRSIFSEGLDMTLQNTLETFYGFRSLFAGYSN